MTDTKKHREIAEAACPCDDDCNEKEEFREHFDPPTVLGLLDEIEQLRNQAEWKAEGVANYARNNMRERGGLLRERDSLREENDRLRKRNELLTDYYECKMRYSERATKLKDEINRLRAELESAHHSIAHHVANNERIRGEYTKGLWVDGAPTSGDGWSLINLTGTERVFIGRRDDTGIGAFIDRAENQRHFSQPIRHIPLSKLTGEEK